MHILEEVLPQCRGSFRLFKLFLTKRDTWISLYEIRKETGVNIKRKYLDRLVKMGLIEYDELFNKCKINVKNSFIQALEEFYREIGY